MRSLADGPNFFADSTFKGSSLSGWHVLGQANWSAKDGEVTGKATGGKGGWLVLDRSYQDIGLYADFRCTGECVTGLLLRAEKTADGMKGVYVSLSPEPAIANVTLDASGQELTRVKLRAAGGTIRFAPPATAPAPPAGGRGGRAPSLHQDDWNATNVILDSDILRVALNGANMTGATDDMSAPATAPSPSTSAVAKSTSAISRSRT